MQCLKQSIDAKLLPQLPLFPLPWRFGLMGASTLFAEPSRGFLVPIEPHWYGPRFPQGHIAIVDRDLKPKDDDLVYARFRFRDHPKMNFEKLLPFWTRGGKDGNGRFVRTGDPREIVACIAPMAIARKDFDNGVVRSLALRAIR